MKNSLQNLSDSVRKQFTTGYTRPNWSVMCLFFGFIHITRTQSECEICPGWLKRNLSWTEGKTKQSYGKCVKFVIYLRPGRGQGVPSLRGTYEWGHAGHRLYARSVPWKGRKSRKEIEFRHKIRTDFFHMTCRIPSGAWVSKH